MQISEQRVVRFQLGIGLRFPDKGQEIHVLQAQVHFLRNLLVREDWILAIHHDLQTSQGESRVPTLSYLQVLRELVPGREPAR